MWQWLGEHGWTLAPLIVAVVALGVGVFQTYQLVKVGSRLDEVGSRLDFIAARSEMSLGVSRLNSPGWVTYVSEAQSLASPEYLQYWRGKYTLTTKGEDVLPREFKGMIDTLLKENKEMPANEVILHLNLGGLFAEALKRDIAPDAMVGIIAAHVEKAKKE